MTKLNIYFVAFIIILYGTMPLMAQPFTHPGLLQGQDDIARIKRAIAGKLEPINSGYVLFQQHPQSQATYKLQGPMDMVGRNPTVGQSIYDADANAAYQNALMWAITGQQVYADKAKEIVNAWSVSLKTITGKDAVLMAGLGPFKMVNAAEILRYTNSGWLAKDVERAEWHFKQVIYPVIKDFALFANGNWDSAAIKTVMAIGVFCNDRTIFEKAINYYIDGAGDGSISNYIVNEDGECQESGRDQGHTQLGIAHLGDCAEIAWHQGLNLYAYADNRLLKGFEYTAKYNLGMDVPYVVLMDRTGKYLHPQISAEGRGKIRAVYEEIYNHYVNRMGLTATYTQQAAEKIRPEPQGLPGADHVGFGTLLYTRPAGGLDVATAPASPAGLIAKAAPAGGIVLTWVQSVGARAYTVKRANKKSGPYVAVATNVINPVYTDTEVMSGKIYYYTVCAVNKWGTSVNAFNTSSAAGLPTGWKHMDIGVPEIKGNSVSNGQQFTLEAGSAQPDSTFKQYQYAYKTLNGNGTITMRYVPQISSQFSKFGLVLRNGLAPNAEQIALIIEPEATKQIESPCWYINLFVNNKAGDNRVASRSPMLTEPIMTNNRLTGYCWLRLQRQGSTITGFSSSDGKTWIPVGKVTSLLNKQVYIGLAASSGLPSITTTVKFDQVESSN